MVWESEGTKYLAEVGLLFKNGRDRAKTVEYIPGEHFSEVTVKFIDQTARIDIVPYKLEVLINKIGKAYGENILHALTTGIRDDSDVQFIGISWRPKKEKFKRVEQYFFNEDKPGGYSSATYSGPTWPSKKPRIIDDALRPYFDELMELKPEASKSIESCVSLLA